MYKNDIMYILASTFGRIIRVNTRISCIHVTCLAPSYLNYQLNMPPPLLGTPFYRHMCEHDNEYFIVQTLTKH